MSHGLLSASLVLGLCMMVVFVGLVLNFLMFTITVLKKAVTGTRVIFMNTHVQSAKRNLGYNILVALARSE